METAKLTGFIITAGHLDIEWYQPLRSYRFWTIETFEDLKKAVKRDDFTCYVLDGQVFPLEEYLEAVPQDEKEMRSLIGQGKLAIGPFYTQFDEWLPSAENMIRNCRSGCMRRFCGCDKGTRSVPATAKMWRRKTAQRAQARLRFFVARAAVRRRSAYRPVMRRFGISYYRRNFY